MEQWEYLTKFCEASAKPKENREFLKKRFGFKKKPPTYTPEALIPELDALGAEGWELVHMEPVGKVGKKGDILFGVTRWSNVYFCAFKRRKNPPQVVPLTASGQPAFPWQMGPPAPAQQQPVPQAAAPQPVYPQQPQQPLSPYTES